MAQAKVRVKKVTARSSKRDPKSNPKSDELTEKPCLMGFTAKQQELLKAITQELRRETALAYIKNSYENRTKSYLDACKKMGRKPSKNPETSASEILNYPNVLEFINSVKVAVAEEVQIDAAWVLRQAVKVHEMCMAASKVYDRSGEPVEDDDGNPVYAFQHAGANKSLEIIGKHVDVAAFSENINIKESAELSPWASIKAGVDKLVAKDEDE